MVVVLPALDPGSLTISPTSSENPMPSTATRLPNVFRRPSTCSSMWIDFLRKLSAALRAVLAKTPPILSTEGRLGATIPVIPPDSALGLTPSD